jgi:polyisoprenoid-binding protein YceI
MEVALMTRVALGGWLLAGLAVVGGERAGADEPQAAGRAIPLLVDLDASRVYIKVGSATRFGHDHGVVGRLASGAVAPGGGGELVFDMRTFVADLPEARSYVGLTASISRSDAQKTTATMLSKDVLDVARFPAAKYVFRSAKPVELQNPGSPGRYRLDGDFTLHGVTVQVPLTAVVEATEALGAMRMRCGFAILQSQFRMTPYSALGGIVGVNDRLEIWGELVVRPSATATAPGAGRAR